MPLVVEKANSLAVSVSDFGPEGPRFEPGSGYLNVQTLFKYVPVYAPLPTKELQPTDVRHLYERRTVFS